MDRKVERYDDHGNRGDVCVLTVSFLLLLLLLMVVVAADVTESQQAIVRVTPADGMQPFTMQSKKDRKKEKEYGRKK